MGGVRGLVICTITIFGQNPRIKNWKLRYRFLCLISILLISFYVLSQPFLPEIKPFYQRVNRGIYIPFVYIIFEFWVTYKKKK